MNDSGSGAKEVRGAEPRLKNLPPPESKHSHSNPVVKTKNRHLHKTIQRASPLKNDEISGLERLSLNALENFLRTLANLLSRPVNAGVR